MLCSLGHDDIQFFISNKSIRYKILKQFYPNWLNAIISTHIIGIKEHQIKIPYEHEIDIDYFDLFEASKIGGYGGLKNADVGVIWEIKPEIIDFGDTLRQIKRYERIVKTNYKKPDLIVLKILLYNNCRFSDEKIKEYFNSEDINTYRVLPSECKQLEQPNYSVPNYPEYKKTDAEDFFYVAGKMDFLWGYHCTLQTSKFDLRTAIEIGGAADPHDITHNDIVKWDIEAVEKSKGTIAIITDKIQVGTITEILHCTRIGKPLLVIFVSNGFHLKKEFVYEADFEGYKGIFSNHHTWIVGSSGNWFVDDYWFLIKYLNSNVRLADFCIVNDPCHLTEVIEEWISREFKI